MSIREIIKYPIRPIFFGAKKMCLKLKGAHSAKGVIFMLHRCEVWEEGKLYYNENMKVSPRKLEQIINHLKISYDFIRLEDVPERMRTSTKRKFAVFTFDDGYRDNLTNALPIFRKYNIPFTIFLTTDFMDREAILWWYVLEDLIMSNNSLNLGNGKTYKTQTKEEKRAAFLQIREEILKIDPQNLLAGLDVLFANYSIKWKEKCKQLCLSWEDVNILKNEPLVTLGAHTQHHYNLSALKRKQDVTDEIIGGMLRLKEVSDIRANVFAYPFGLAGEREFAILAELKNSVVLAVKANGGPVSEKDNNIYALPRIFLEESFNKYTLTRVSNIYI